MTKIIEAIKFTGTNLNDIFKLECVDSVTKDCNGDPMVFLKPQYTQGRGIARKDDYLCKFANGMWQVFGQEAYMNEIKQNRQEIPEVFSLGG